MESASVGLLVARCRLATGHWLSHTAAHRRTHVTTPYRHSCLQPNVERMASSSTCASLLTAK